MKPGYAWRSVTPDAKVTWYYTPEYPPQPSTEDTDSASPNNWTDKGKGSPYYDSSVQGSVIVNGVLWKWNNNSRTFFQQGNSCPNGVPLVSQCLNRPSPGRPTGDGRTSYTVDVAVASCPGTKFCNPEFEDEEFYDPNFKPLYQQNGPTLYVVTNNYVLIASPKDSGGGLEANQIDIYTGAGGSWPYLNYPNEGDGNARVWIQVCVDQSLCGGK